MDGKPARILRADYLLRGVVVPGGRHRVLFELHSAAMKRGWMVSLISAALAVAAIVWGWFLNRRGTDARASA